jgi:RNA polymerase sigma factor (TIGR02999 family)
MRRILVEKARRKQRVRHGGGLRRVSLEEDCAIVEPLPDDLLALNEALERFEALDASRAEIVKLRFFAGLTTPQAAKAMGISVSTAERYWSFARTWLFAEISGTPAPPEKK